jgi:nonsense-mediated mRNA decay protein 3
MTKRFCALCGKTDVPLIENLCESCYLKKNPPFTVKHEFEVRICPHCYSYKLSKKWVQTNSFNPKEFLEIVIEQNSPRFIKHSPEFEIIIQPQIAEDVELTGKIDVPILITAKKNDTTISETVKVTIKLESSPCGICTKKKQGAYEAIVQFRGLRGRISEEERQQIYQIIDKALESERYKDEYIPQIKEKKEGFDLYVSSTGLAKNIATSTKEQMGANIQESFKLSGMKDGKKKGTTSVSVRLPSFTPGEIIQLMDKTLIFEKIEKGNIIGKNPKTGEKQIIQYKDFWESEIQSWKPETKQYLIISKTKDTIQLMDLKTYEITEIKREQTHTNLKEGEIVQAIKIDEEITILSPET